MREQLCVSSKKHTSINSGNGEGTVLYVSSIDNNIFFVHHHREQYYIYHHKNIIIYNASANGNGEAGKCDSPPPQGYIKNVCGSAFPTVP